MKAFLGKFKTFFEKVEAEAKKLFGSTSWEKTASSVITYAAPIAESLVGLAAGQPAEALVTGVVNAVKADLTTVSAVVSGAQAPPGSTLAVTVRTALTSINTNLASLLSASEVKDSKTASEITEAVTLLTGEVDALLSSLPAAA